MLVGLQTGETTMETVWNFLRKLKKEMPFDPAVPLLGIYPNSPETPIQQNLCTRYGFIAAQFTIAKSWKQPKCPSANEWIKTLWYLYTMEFHAEERKEFLPSMTTWMELESTVLSEISPVVKDKYHMISPLTGI